MADEQQHQEPNQDHEQDSVGAPPEGTWLAQAVESGKITRVMLAVPDMRGRPRGKILNAPLFMDRLGGQAEMCAYTLATDVDMTPLSDFALTGWDQGFGDVQVKADTATARTLPYQPITMAVPGW